MRATAPVKLGFFILLCIIWGTTWLVIKIGLNGMPPFLGVSLRFFLAALILTSAGLFFNGKPKITMHLLKVMVYIGFLLFTLGYGIVYWAEQFIPSGLASVMFATMPFFVAIFAHYRLPEEPLSLIKISGIIIGIVGVAFIFSESIKVGSDLPLKGIIAMMLSPIGAALSAIIMKKHAGDNDPFFINAGSMLFGATCLLLAYFVLESDMTILWNFTTIGAILYLSIVGSSVAFAVYFWLLRHTDATTLSFVTFFAPVIAVALGWLLLSETLSAPQLLGSGLVLVGVIVSESKNFKEKYRHSFSDSSLK